MRGPGAGSLTARIKSSTYENIILDCPTCRTECLLNRATDLGTFEPVAGASVTCTACGGEFWAIGDSVGPRYQALIFECYPLLQRKAYMASILSLAQAHEVFFSTYLQGELVFRPFWLEPHRGVDAANAVSTSLTIALERLTYGPLLSCVLDCVGRTPVAADLDEAKAIIEGWRPQRGKLACPTDLDPRVSSLLDTLVRSEVAKLRNRVVHKAAYRPTRDEVENALALTRSTLLPLGAILKVDDDVNAYRS